MSYRQRKLQDRMADGRSAYGCFVRHPMHRHSEVPDYMSDEAIALSGFAGHRIATDPRHGIFEFFLGSRVIRMSTPRLRGMDNRMSRRLFFIGAFNVLGNFRDYLIKKTKKGLTNR